MDKLTVFILTGILKGTTYSGHPTCTSCCGTLRNLIYNYFALELEQHDLTFHAEIDDL